MIWKGLAGRHNTSDGLQTTECEDEYEHGSVVEIAKQDCHCLKGQRRVLHGQLEWRHLPFLRRWKGK